MILMTGGQGLLGTALNLLHQGIIRPPRADLDILQADSLRIALDRYRPKVLLHAAAYTRVKKAETERQRCWQTNVEGTRNIVRVLQAYPQVFLVHISTDYVFYGDRGGYRENDTVGPVRNTYALSKLVAEEVARLASQLLIIRTSFRPSIWPYPTAFSDVYTSQDYVDVIAAELSLALDNLALLPTTLHIATERKTVYELAKRRNPGVLAATKAEAGVNLPDDISLDVSLWQELKRKKLRTEV